MKPLIISFENKKVVIFGGGRVGKRKASFFADEAEVVVVSEEFVDGFGDLDVKLVKKDLDSGEDVTKYLGGAFLVIPATDNEELNKDISREAKSRDILVNRVGETIDDVILPSCIQNNYLIAISSLGKSPAFCKFMRKKLERELGNEYDLMVKLQKEIRDKLKREISSQDKRKKILRKILEDKEIWECLQKNFYEKAVNRCKKIIGEEHG